MKRIASLYTQAERFPVIGALFRRLRYPLKKVYFYTLQRHNHADWKRRLHNVQMCPDNTHIPRVPDAGKTVNGFLIMHNGLKIIPGSYYGEPMHRVLRENRGVHEPQEEHAFLQLLPYLPTQATMLELGAYWGFYSMWFHKEVPQPTCFLVEPEISNLKYGQENFAANDMQGVFIRGLIGAKSEKPTDGISVFCVDDLASEYHISHIHVLHADIQGAELAMLQGARGMLQSHSIDYLFISTHTEKLHEACTDFLLEHGLIILIEINLQETYEEEGLIVAHREGVAVPSSFILSKR